MTGFHSIGFPSEWGQDDHSGVRRGHRLQVSIQLVSPASGDKPESDRAAVAFGSSFHSIGFPSEWGLPAGQQVLAVPIRVSIQLVSPASGD